MAIRGSSLDQKHYPHPNVGVVPTIRITGDADRYVNEVATNALSEGADLTVMGTSHCPGLAQGLHIELVGTASGGGYPGVTLRIWGDDQFGKPIVQDMTRSVAGATINDADGNPGRPFALVRRVQCTALTNPETTGVTVALGINGGTNSNRIALPFKIKSSTVGDAGQVVSIHEFDGTDRTEDLALDTKYHAWYLTGGSNVRGMYYLTCNFQPGDNF